MKPSEDMPSSITAGPIRYPPRIPRSRYGVRVMFSMPTTRATSISPRMIDPAASVSALALDPHALLTV